MVQLLGNTSQKTNATFRFPLNVHKLVEKVASFSGAVTHMSALFYFTASIRPHQQPPANHHHFAGKQAICAGHDPRSHSAVKMTDATMGKGAGDGLFTAENSVRV